MERTVSFRYDVAADGPDQDRIAIEVDGKPIEGAILSRDPEQAPDGAKRWGATEDRALGDAAGHEWSDLADALADVTRGIKRAGPERDESRQFQMEYGSSGGDLQPGWYLTKLKAGAGTGDGPETREWVKGPGQIEDVREELARQGHPDAEAIIERGVRAHLEGSCRSFLQHDSLENLERLQHATETATREWTPRAPSERPRAAGDTRGEDTPGKPPAAERREEAVFRIDGNARPLTLVPAGIDYSVNGGHIRLRTERPLDVVVECRGGYEGHPEATLESDHAGTITMEGRGAGTVNRTGAGDGDAVRTGPGVGDARRGGAGAGQAWRPGPGNGSATRGGEGNGHAFRTGSGDGDAIRTGTGHGDAHCNTSGQGNAEVELGARGNAVRGGTGDGNARIGEVARGHAIRKGSGRGDAERGGTGDGHAWRGGEGAGDARNTSVGRGHAIRTGEGPGTAERGNTGPGRACTRDTGWLDKESRKEIEKIGAQYEVTNDLSHIQKRQAPEPAAAPPAAGPKARGGRPAGGHDGPGNNGGSRGR